MDTGDVIGHWFVEVMMAEKYKVGLTTRNAIGFLTSRPNKDLDGMKDKNEKLVDYHMYETSQVYNVHSIIFH